MYMLNNLNICFIKKTRVLSLNYEEIDTLGAHGYLGFFSYKKLVFIYELTGNSYATCTWLYFWNNQQAFS